MAVRAAVVRRAAVVHLATAVVGLASASCGPLDSDADGDVGGLADTGMGGEADVAVVGQTDMVPYTCEDSGWTPGPCVAGNTFNVEGTARNHVSEPEVIVYDAVPPVVGPHRPSWAKWGEYEFLPPQRYLHNAEHGGVALLYNPCASAEVVDALRSFAQERPADDGGAFRWVLTPAPGLTSAVAAVAWEWGYTSECVDPAELGAFVDAHYRRAPEDIAADGSFSRLWLGR